MNNIVCPACGGSVKRKGNYYVCDFCRGHWIVDISDDVHAVERANAWEALRCNDFEKAIELFENIIAKDAKNHEAYWGRALAMNSIVYVNDYNENKKVPTCNNISEESFLTNKDVKKAISLAPAEIKESYQKQAEQIEKIRVEWLNKASKEPAYDVFISFKDSDREHGIERTQDSIDAQDLYTALVAKGYNVFFSRVTLRDKVSEQYEPYIYNAIKTAKVMIVFGEKAEHFNAVWIKNEWSRFKARIGKGEKHKNSLITVYKGVAPNDIPLSLTGGRQAIDYSIPSNYEILMNHIKRIIDESKKAVHLERIEIKGGQKAKKSSQIKTETIEVREIGKGAEAETDIDTEQKLTLVYTYIKSGLWNDAEDFINDVLFENPTSAKAYILKLFLKYRIVTSEQLDFNKLFACINSFSDGDIGIVNHAISIADKTLAENILNAIYSATEFLGKAQYIKLLKLVLPYNYDKREANIKNLFETAIIKEGFEAFNLLLTTLNSSDVDSYIDYNIAFAKNTQYLRFKKICAENVLSVHVGNVDALRIIFVVQMKEEFNGAMATFKNLLKYSSDIKAEVKTALSSISECEQFTEYHCKLAQEILKYYPGELVEIEKELEDLAQVMVANSYFKYAEDICSLIIGFNKNSQKAYWYLCLCEIEAQNEQEIVNSDIPIRNIPEFKKYLTLTSEKKRLEALDISIRQTENIETKKIEVEIKEKEKRTLLSNKKRKVRNILFAICANLLLLGLTYIGFYMTLVDRVIPFGPIVIVFSLSVLFGIFLRTAIKCVNCVLWLFCRIFRVFCSRFLCWTWVIELLPIVIMPAGVALATLTAPIWLAINHKCENFWPDI